MQHIATQQNGIRKSILYSMVFDVVAVRYVTAFLFMFFVLHPVVPALAAEEDVAETSMVEQVLPEPELEAEPESEPETALVEVSVEPEESMPQEEESQEEIDETDVSLEVSEEVGDETDEEMVSDILLDEGEEILDGEQISIEDDYSIQEELDTESSHESTSNSDSSGDSSSEAEEDESEGEGEASDEEVLTEEGEAGSEVVEGTDLEALSKLLSGSTQEPSGEVVGASTTQVTTVDDTQSEQSSGNITTSGDADESDDEDASEELIETEQVEINEESKDETSSAEEVSEVVVESNEATTTQDSVASTTQDLVKEAGTIVNNNNRHQFSDKECVAVGDGSFYCSEIENAPEYIEDRVFSAPDSEGDTEIFVTIAGKTTQITHNTIDDASPQYDGISDTIVWHSMQNDRFQIAQYTVADGSIEYLTDTTYNNTEPVAYGDIVMWQAWIEDNWEIMLFDNGEVAQLTDNEMHDITPQMRDGYIMWQTQFAEGWKVALYDQKTQKVSYIADSDGSGVANPRFVLVYDSTDKVGDVRTLGYDFGSGSSFTLGSLPAEMPEQIPEPDQTGETRALIQAKPSTREGEIEDIQPVPSGTGTSTDATTGTTSDSVADDLVIIPLETVASSTQDVAEESLTATEITDQSDEEIISSPEEGVSHINDIVIPPFMGTTTDEVS